jgi:hypothetical protein
VKLLVEKLTIDRDEDGRAKVDVTTDSDRPRKSPVVWLVYRTPGCFWRALLRLVT